jgi:hypothetical protein
MTVERERPSGPATPEGGFWSAEEEPEPDWVAGIHEARRRRADRLAVLLSEPDASSEPEDPSEREGPFP